MTRNKHFQRAEQEKLIAQLEIDQRAWEEMFDTTQDEGKRALLRRNIETTAFDITSAKRVLEKMAVPTDAELKTMRDALHASVAAVKGATGSALAEITATADLLQKAWAHLTKATEYGADAQAAAMAIIRMLPRADRENYRNIPHALALTDAALASGIEHDMMEAGIFSKIAPCPWAKQMRHDQPPMAEFMTTRFARLLESVDQIATKVEAGL
jgi:hypothetical protein